MGYDEKFLEDMRKRQLGLDDTFNFNCLTECRGQCCHRDDLILTAFDIYRIAKYKEQTMSQVITDNCFAYMGSDSKLPIISVKPRIGDKSCRFLRMGRCEVHECKPISCKLFPLGRYLPATAVNADYVYFLQPINCGGKDKQVVRDWIGDDMPENDIACKAWGKVIVELAQFLQGIKNDRQLQGFQQIILYALYFNYDPALDNFIEQLEYNVDKLQTVLPGFKRGK